MQQDSRQLVLFILLSVGILFVWGYLFPPPKPPKTPPKHQLTRQISKKNAKHSKHAKRTPPTLSSAKQPSPTSRPVAAATSRPTSMAATQPAQHASVRTAPPASRATSVALPAPAGRTLSYQGKLVHATVSDKGGIVNWKLTAFRDMEHKDPKQRLDLISKLLRVEAPFSERLLDKNLVKHQRIAYQTADKPKPNVLRMTGRIPSTRGGFVEVEKRYIFEKNTYRFRMELRITNKTNAPLDAKMAMRLRDMEDPKKLVAGGMFSFQTEQIQLLCMRDHETKPSRLDYLKLQGEAEKKLQKNPTQSADKVFVSHLFTGNINYIAIDRRYFVMAAIPQWGKSDRSMGCAFRANKLGRVSAEFQNAGLSLAPGNSHTLQVAGYFGPKYYETLKSAGAHLETSIDFGMFAFLCKPMLWTMQFFYNALAKIRAANWGIAIILLTLLIKLLMWPLTNKSMESMKKMQRLKPEMDRLKEKYGEDKESFQREMMNLYVKEGINPISGCLPMLLQMPIWIALYQTILYSVELYQARFIPGWIEDLSAKDPVFVLPVLLGASMIVQHKLTPQTLDNAQAKIMGWVMPVFFTVIMLFLPAGLTLYIFVNTVLGIGHQWYIYQKPDKPEPPKNNKKKESTRQSWMQRMQQYVEDQQKQQPKQPQKTQQKPRK